MRVFVLGLDAASPALMQRWQADLPTFRRVMTEGTWGTLQSITPPFTSPAWACMATGKNPAKVGIFGLRHRQPNSYQLASPTSADRKALAVWDIVSQAGKRVIVHNVPDTFPPTPVNGVLVSGHPAPSSGGAEITYPAGLRTTLDTLTNTYPIGPPADFDQSSRQDELATWQTVLAKHQTALLHLLDTQDWDLCFTVSLAIDAICHHFWQYLDPQHPDFDPVSGKQFGDTIRQIYKQEDQRLAQILARLTPDDLLLIVSDHGSTPCYRHISVNRWLIDNGYLVLKKDEPPPAGRTTSRLSQTLVNLYRRFGWIRRLSQPLRQTAWRDRVVQAHFAHKTGGRVTFASLPIDWQKTRAYYIGDDRLYLNVSGREPQGIVQPGQPYHQLRDELRQKLLALRDPLTQQPLFVAIHTREELYNGPYLTQAPDLIVSIHNEHDSPGGAVGQTLIDKPIVSGKHHPDGLFMAWGKGIRPGASLAHLYDIAPTILHALNLPIPQDSDGTVQLNWFHPHSAPAQTPIRTAHYPETNFTDYTWQADEAQEIEDRLRDLGYLD